MGRKKNKKRRRLELRATKELFDAVKMDWPPERNWRDKLFKRLKKSPGLYEQFAWPDEKEEAPQPEKKRHVLQTKWERLFAAMLEQRMVPFRANKKFRCLSGKTYYPDLRIGTLVVEIDGKQCNASPEQRRNDSWRTCDLKDNGIKRVLRLWNWEVEQGESNRRVLSVLRECENSAFGRLESRLTMDCG